MAYRGMWKAIIAMKSAVKSIICMAALLVLSGCGLMHFAEEPHPWPNERRLLAKDWVVPQVSAKEEQVYCYRTLGKVDCHGDPLGKEEQRRVLGDDESGDVKGFWENIWQPD